MFYWIVTSIISVLWFLNLVQLLEKLKLNKNIKNQKILGALLSFVFTFLLILSFGYYN